MWHQCSMMYNKIVKQGYCRVQIRLCPNWLLFCTVALLTYQNTVQNGTLWFPESPIPCYKILTESPTSRREQFSFEVHSLNS